MRIEQLESRRLLSGGPHGGGGTVEAGTVNFGVATISGGTLNLAGTTTIYIKSGQVLFNNIVHKPGDAIDINGVKVGVTSKGTLTIEGSQFNDSISVTTNKKSYTIDVYGKPAFYFSRAEIKRIRIEGGAGKDTLGFTGNQPDVPVSLLGGDGNDTIRSSAGTTLIGGEGDDNLSAAGSSTFFIQSGDTNATVISGTASFGTWQTVQGHVLVGSSDTDTGSLIEGGNGNDTITASSGPDTINGGRGSDAITRTVFNDALIPFDDEISPGDTVTSIEAFKVINVNTSSRFTLNDGTIQFIPKA